MYLHDAQRSASAGNSSGLSYRAVASLSALWQNHLGSPISSSATVVDQTVYVGTWSGYEYALNASSGSVLWHAFLGLSNDSGCVGSLGVTSTASVVNGTVYVTGGNATVYALSSATGQIEWSLAVGNTSAGYFLWASPLVVGDRVYQGVASQCDSPLVPAKLLEIDATSGQILATFDTNPDGQLGASIWGSPTLDAVNGSIFFATGNGGPRGDSVIGVNATTLALQGYWTIPNAQKITDGDFGNTPTLFASVDGARWFAVADKNGILYAFNESHISAGPVWEYPIAIGGPGPLAGEGSISPATYYDGRLFAAGGKTVIGGVNCSGSVRAFDPWTGAVLWQYCAPGTVLGALASANGMIIAGAGATLAVLNATSGVAVWSEGLGARIMSAASLAEGRLYASDSYGRILAFAERNASEPPLVSNAASAYDPTAKEVVLFGGCASSGCPGAQTWAYRYGYWYNLTPASPNSSNSPSPRSEAALTWDSSIGRLVLFGGRASSGTLLNDTWEFGPGGWARVATSVAPPARAAAGFAMDRSDKEAVLFGGVSGPPDHPTFFGDTWAFAGQKWKNLTAGVTAAPSPRGFSAFVAIGVYGGDLLFGGEGATGALGDTWKFTAGSWVALAAGVSPPPAYACGATYDAVNGTVLLFGGMGPSGTQATFWEFLNGAWSELPTPGKIPARSAPAFVYDGSTHYAYLYGGLDAQGLLLGDGWKYADLKWYSVPVRV